MKIAPLAGHCGAEITGIHLRSLNDADVIEIDRALTMYKVGGRALD